MLYLRSKEDPSKAEELQHLIFDEIDHRNRFIYCKSPIAEESPWVKDEIRYIKSKDRVFKTNVLAITDNHTVLKDSKPSNVGKAKCSIYAVNNILLPYENEGLFGIRSLPCIVRRQQAKDWLQKLEEWDNNH